MCQFQVHPEVISCTLPPPTMIAFCFLLFSNDNDSKQLMTEAVTAHRTGVCKFRQLSPVSVSPNLSSYTLIVEFNPNNTARCFLNCCRGAIGILKGAMFPLRSNVALQILTLHMKQSNIKPILIVIFLVLSARVLLLKKSSYKE